MKINISENLRRLRNLKEITQEDLANFIGVSFQAVSKWERDEGYPDITTLPIIANFFNVSLDELVGMNEIKNSVKRSEILTKHRELISAGKIDEDVVYLREAVKLFPNDYELLSNLAYFLENIGETEENIEKNRNEAIKISEKIIRFCNDNQILNNVQCNLSSMHWRHGEKDRAIELAKTLPDIYKTKDLTLCNYLSGDEKVKECQVSIQKLCWAFWSQITSLSKTENYSTDEKLELLRKSIAIYELVYDSGDYNFTNIRIYHSYILMTKICLQNNRTIEAIDYIEKAAEHSIAFSTLPEKKKHESILVNTLWYNILDTATSSANNNCSHMKHNILNDPVYKPILNDKRIITVINELNKYAK